MEGGGRRPRRRRKPRWRAEARRRRLAEKRRKKQFRERFYTKESHPEIWKIGYRKNWTKVQFAKLHKTHPEGKIECHKCGILMPRVECPEGCSFQGPHIHWHCARCGYSFKITQKRADPRERKPDRYDRFYLNALLDGRKTGREVEKHVHEQTAAGWDKIKVLRRLLSLRYRGYVEYEYRFFMRRLLWRLVYDYKRVYRLTEKGRKWIEEWKDLHGK